MQYFVYVLRSKKDKKLYTSLTANVSRRLEEHNKGYEKSTKSRRPFEVILTEKFGSRVLARKREKYLKSGHGREYLKSIFPGSSAGRARGCAEAKGRAKPFRQIAASGSNTRVKSGLSQGNRNVRTTAILS